MNNLLTATIAAFVCAISTSAQSFNTITNTQPHYRVLAGQAPLDGAGQERIGTKKEVQPEGNTSLKADPIESTQNITKPTLASSDYNNTSLPNMSLPLKQVLITSPYGNRRDPFNGKSAFHSGTDLRAYFEPVYSMLTGVVAKCGYDRRSGFYVTMQHGNLSISYCHLSKIRVKQGDTILSGQLIATSGTSGRSTGPHLHIGARLSSNRIDSSLLLRIAQAQAGM